MENTPLWRKLVPAVGCQPDFQACLDAFPDLEFAKTTRQDLRFHGEGDVWTHTMMVVEELLDLPQYQAASRADQETVFLAALLHDIAKYSTTSTDPATGKIASPGHSRKGAIDARIALWDMGVPFATREAICRMISVHQAPFFALESSRHTPEFIVRELSWILDIRLLAMLARADISGRIFKDKQSSLENIDLFEELAREEQCYGTPRAFTNVHTAVSYFRGANVHPDSSLYQESGSKVLVMSGLPASGKNTWVAQHYPDLPVISFDDTREELGLRFGKNEGLVAHKTLDKAKDLLRQKKTFVWNSTNITTIRRKKTLDLLYSYNAEVKIIYLEKQRSELLQRNSMRNTSLTNRALQDMLMRWEVPLPTEAHAVIYEN